MEGTGREPSRLEGLLCLLEHHYGTPGAQRFADPFEMILWEIVAYLADDVRRKAAFEALRTRVGLKPEQILAAPEADLLAVTTTGGRIAPELRATRLIEASQLVIDDFEGDLSKVLSLPSKEAKKALMKFPMTGEPGAEKILLFFGALPVLALESNGMRVLTRLGFGIEEKDYSKTYRLVREAVTGQLPIDTAILTKAHLLLRHHGQVTCRRGVPSCLICPISTDCPFAQS